MTGHIICWSLISAFSFFRNVFVSNQGIEAKQYEIIIEHEKEHVRCRHSFDVVFFELMFILNWYNPLFYFYRHLLQESHEFEVDNKLLNSGVSLEHYLQAMFSASFNGSTALLVNRFFSHPLKRRISMLQRSWKEEWSDFRIVYGIPFLLVVFISLVFSTDATKVSGFESQQIFGGNSRSGLPFENPIPPEHNPVITSGYGERIHPIKKVQAMHRGIDISASKGTPVVAVAEGQVIHVEENWVKGKNYGRYIVVSHADNYASLYAQLSSYKVKNGQFVKKGDVLGEVGASGIATGYHLHFEMRKDGGHVDPMLYLKDYVEQRSE